MADELEVNTDQGEWLSLGKAATLLGVHSMTLRRWSDKGRFPSLRTPGGHRRFARKDIDYFLSKQQADVEVLPENWAESALIQTRQEVAHHQGHPWMQTVIEHDLRNEHKQLGHQLMGLLMQYVAAEEPNDTFLKEAQRIGRKYGAYGRRAGLTLTSILEATFFFRDILVESSLKIPSTTYVKSDASLLILRRVNQIVNTVQLSVSDYYEKTAR